MKCFQRYACLITALLAVSGSALAQTSSTSLQGTVSDPSGSAIQGATAALVNAGSMAERATVTGGQGEYNFLALPPGTYTLTISAKGFTRYEQKDIQLLVNTPATVNVRLRVGAATETVTVTGEAPALNMVDASIGNSFNQTQVRDIPLEGRNVPEMLSLQAGVAYTGNRHDIDRDQDTRNGPMVRWPSRNKQKQLDGTTLRSRISRPVSLSPIRPGPAAAG